MSVCDVREYNVYVCMYVIKASTESLSLSVCLSVMPENRMYVCMCDQRISGVYLYIRDLGQ